MRIPRRLLLAAALILLILFPTLLLVQAQTTSDTQIEFYGTVQSANAAALVINGQLIDISSAQVNAPLVAGMVVHVQATLAPDGSLVAQQVDPVAPGTLPGLVEIDGIVSELSDTTLQIGSQTIDISNAQIAAPLAVGQTVHVYAVSDSSGVWGARLITSDAAPPLQTPEVAPPIATSEIIPPAVTPEVNPQNNAPVQTPEVLPPASTPEVSAPASTPEVVEEGEDFDIRGTLDGFTDAEVIVDGKHYFIGGAEIDGRLHPGAQVRLKIRVVNGQWVLEEIKVEDSGGNSGSGGSGNSGSGSSNSGSGSGSSNSGSGSSNSGSGSGNSGSGSGDSGSGSGNSGSGGGGSGSGSGSSGSGGNSGSGGGNSGSGGGGDDHGGHGGGDDD